MRSTRGRRSRDAWLAGRISIHLDNVALARQHLTESIRLGGSTGSRIGRRGAWRRRGAARARETAGAGGPADRRRQRAPGGGRFPPLPGARVEKYLAPARRLGEPAVARAWAQGLAVNADAAVALALGEAADSGADPPLTTAVRTTRPGPGPPR